MHEYVPSEERRLSSKQGNLINKVSVVVAKFIPKLCDVAPIKMKINKYKPFRNML